MLYNFKPLGNAGFRFTFLAPESEAFHAFQNDWTDCPEVEFIPVPVKNHRFSLWHAVRQTLKTKRYSLLHSQGFRAGTETEIGNFFARIPHIVTLHDVINPFNQVPGRFKGLKKIVASFFARRASVIIPVSNDCRDIYLRNFPLLKIGPCKISVIINGVPVDRLLASRSAFAASPQMASLRERLPIEQGVVLGGFFGRFMPEKGIKVLLDALTILSRKGYRDRFCLLATKDPHGYRGETIRAVQENPDISGMVHFIDPVSDIVPLLTQVDFLVTPSLWEACPILPMEAMVLGVPVIGSDCPGLREVLRDTPSLTPPKDNPGALANAIVEFIENPLTEQAKTFEAEAQKRFNVERAATELLNLYEKVAS